VRVCVAFSGGADSTALLHGLCRLRAERDGLELRAVHVNHGLHPDAGSWAAHCRRVCEHFSVPIVVRHVTVGRVQGGPEAAARAARYAAFADVLGDGELFVTAHHEDDQLETMLLRLARGTGPAGLAGIPVRVPFGRGTLLRPLLSLPRELLRDQAEEADVGWIDDPANSDCAVDRSYLRRRVVPALRARWPAVGVTAGRAARLCGEASALIDALAGIDAGALAEGPRIALNGFRELEPARQRNLLRFVARRHGVVPPGEARLADGLRQLMEARPDGSPVLAWPGGQFRRYRDHLYFLDFDPDAIPMSGNRELAWDGHGVLELGPVRGRLTLREEPAGELAACCAGPGVKVRFRAGGERLRARDRSHHRSLKDVLREHGVVPWMRRHVPLLYRGDALMAVGDLCVSGDALPADGEPAWAVVWSDHAAAF